ncbi:hypothetical protein OC25_00135 [Pedobacter kyungheensis]|uniref:F5/8 type C domain-containing protein n=1 Tax=Pedobacter kyungheensis TaxID=1069985 RepID=A0A0C1DGU1_9SPHI|nr:DUF5000 domain-containing lipoprotein [Pedobacter kyungheensis]KIA96871.1 hypothetical protein OC25_00135 [Pedobacter kyungheensis]
MKRINKNLLLFLLTLTVAFSGCKEDQLGPLENNTTPPGKVSNVTIKNGAGNASITFSLPADKDLLYVKAVYYLANGQEMEVKTSYYGNTLLVEGFGDTNEHEVKIYAVNRSEVASEPTIVKVKPLENPIWGVYRSLKAVADFGGLNFKGSNPAKADLAIEVLVLSKGKYVPTAKNIYTAAPEIDQSIRGLDTLTQKFAITIRDRWLNYSDTLFTTLKPLYETVLPKSTYKEVILPTDSPQEYTSTGVSKMWDGNIIDWPSVCLTKTTVLTPQWVTFDLGRTATLSRIVVWNYPEYLNAGRTYYYGGNLKDFEIWGTDNPPADGSFNNWVMLGKYSSTKPSKSAYGVQTSEDYAFANAGISYNFAVGLKKVRYIRIKSINNWQGTSFMSVSEVQLYGDPR